MARYNISRNDKERIFHLSAAENTLVHDNAIYVLAGTEVQMLLVSDWSGWADGAVFRSNAFYVEGKATYGHAASRSKDGTYGIAPGWGPARGILFEGNRYYGDHANRPEDSSAVAEQAINAPKLDWDEPVFDAASPDDFDQFLRKHRQWMMTLFEKQFGRPLKLSR